MENNPQINLTVGSQEFHLRRDNTELYQYFGALAIWSHIFVEDLDEEEIRRGTFIPREFIGHEPFDMIAAAMVEHEYPVRLNQRSVDESDAEIITKILAGKDIEKLNDYCEDDWS